MWNLPDDLCLPQTGMHTVHSRGNIAAIEDRCGHLRYHNFHLCLPDSRMEAIDSSRRLGRGAYFFSMFVTFENGNGSTKRYQEYFECFQVLVGQGSSI
jgi:hypothetical protein